MNAFWLAVQFLTRLPVPRGVAYSPEALGRSVVFYPWVGLMLGVLLLALHVLLQNAGASLGAALLLTLWVLLTGALHLDGLADSADAWVGGHGDAPRSLDIMKDPCSGPIAVASIVLLLLVKYGALVELAGKTPWPVLFAPVVGRALIPLLLLTTPYVRERGLGSPLVENLPRRAVLLSAILALFFSLLALGPWPLLAAGLSALGLRAMMLKRLGGCTGDTLGASIEIAEAAALVVGVLAET
jgi:adenosylcobinamide-GDP ribazoletransferase